MMAGEWKVRRSLPGDLEAILRIERACAEAPQWSGAAWREALAEMEIREPARASLVAEGNGDLLGFAVVSCACGIAELESIAVAPENRRMGIGRALCEAAIAWSGAQAAETIELEVRASSGGALALYGSLGFLEQGRRRRYYRDPAEDAILMSAALRD